MGGETLFFPFFLKSCVPFLSPLATVRCLHIINIYARAARCARRPFCPPRGRNAVWNPCRPVRPRFPPSFLRVRPLPGPAPCGCLVTQSPCLARRLVSRMTDFMSETPQHSFFSKKSVPGCCVFGKVALPLQRFSAHEDPFRVERFF